jgi:hypothetical protein
MSAPDTNLEKQKRRHWFPLVAMIGGLVLVSIFGLAVAFITAEPVGEGEADQIPSPSVDEAPLVIETD